MGMMTNADGQVIDTKPEPDTLPERPSRESLEWALSESSVYQAEQTLRAELAHLRAELLQKDMVIAAQKEELAARMAEILQLRASVAMLEGEAQGATIRARQATHAELMKLRMEVDDMKEELAGAGSDGRDLKRSARKYAQVMEAWARGTVAADVVGDFRFDLLKTAEAYGSPVVVEAVEEESQDEHAHTY